MSDDKCRRWRWRSLRRTPAASRGHLPCPLLCLSPSITGRFRSRTGNLRVLSAFPTSSGILSRMFATTPSLASHHSNISKLLIPVLSLIRQDNCSQMMQEQLMTSFVHKSSRGIHTITCSPHHYPPLRCCMSRAKYFLRIFPRL